MTTRASRSAEGGRRAATFARLAATVAITLVGLAALTFFIGRVMPVDPVLAIVGDQADQETYRAVYAQLGLDKPLPVQFLYYLRDIVTGNFGTAIATGHPVIEDIRRVFPATVELATVSLIGGILFGVPLGIAAAVRRGRAVDHVARFFGLFGYSVPHFWLGLIALIVFYGWLGWIGGTGRVSMGFVDVVPPVTGMILVDSALDRNWEVFRDALSHIVAPALILATTSTAYISRLTRSFMLEQLAQEYVITARIKGLPGWGVTYHAFRNIAVPLLTVVVLAYGGLLDGAVLTETVFGWPGFGQYLTAGLLAGDMNVVLACTLIVGVIFLTLNLASDVLYRVLDPRTR